MCVRYSERRDDVLCVPDHSIAFAFCIDMAGLPAMVLKPMDGTSKIVVLDLLQGCSMVRCVVTVSSCVNMTPNSTRRIDIDPKDHKRFHIVRCSSKM